MNSIVGKIIAVIMALLLLAYMAVHVFNLFYEPYVTETVKMSTYTQSTLLDGFFVRNESVLPMQKSDVINYKYKNGEKIPKDAIIADIFGSESDLYNIKRIESLNSELASYRALKASQGTEGLKIDMLTSQVNLSLLGLVGSVESGKLSEIPQIKNDLIYNLNKIDMSIDGTITMDERISALESEIANISAGLNPTSAPIKSEQSGYFSNSVDGYEEAFTLSMLENLTVTDVSTMLTNREEFAPNNIGKLQLDSDWYFVSLVDARSVEKLKVGQKVNITFSSKTVKSFDVTVSQIIAEKNNSKSVLVLYSNYIDESLMSMRFEKPQATLSTYTGVVVPKEAVRMSNVTKTVVNEATKEESTVETQVKGVYTMLGKTVRFKELDIIYEDDYVVVSKPNENAGYVSVYDKVIIKGKNLNETN